MNNLELTQKLSDISIADFLSLLDNKKENNANISDNNKKETFRGIKRLAQLLEISYRTALEIKKSDVIPYSQPSPRVFIFRYADVLQYKKVRKERK
jgi:hypothetical protein